jgi:hypothetical protein
LFRFADKSVEASKEKNRQVEETTALMKYAGMKSQTFQSAHRATAPLKRTPAVQLPH